MSRWDPDAWHWCSECSLRVTQTHECPHRTDAAAREPAAPTEELI